MKTGMAVQEIENSQVLRLDNTVVVDYLHDGKALSVWIEACRKTKSVHTVRSYEKEAVRFRIWLEHRHDSSAKLFAQADSEDANAYLDFLDCPAPFPDKLLERYNRTTQPFDGPLKPSSKTQALRILTTMYSAFRKIPDENRQPYTPFNPFEFVKAVDNIPVLQEGTFLQHEKILPGEAWSIVSRYLDDQVLNDPKNPKAQRDRWVMHLLYETWLRREEAANLRMNHFQLTPSGWELFALGKGNKLRSIIVLDSLLDALRQYRLSLGMTPYPDKNDSRPAILPFRGVDNVSPQTVYRICTEVMEAIALQLEANPIAGLDYLPILLRNVAPHWMRHTGASHTADAGADPKYVSNQLGHKDIRITMNTYYHPDRAEMRAQLEAAAKKRPSK